MPQLYTAGCAVFKIRWCYRYWMYGTQTHKHEIETMDEVIAAYTNEQKGQLISLLRTIDNTKQKSLNHFETKTSPFALPYYAYPWLY